MVNIKKIGIAGIGGIGSNVAVHLVRSGIENLKIVDFDIVDRTNLNRQFYFEDQIGLLKTEELEKNLRRINKKIIIEKENILLKRENINIIFDNFDIIIEGFDKIEDKTMIIDCFADKKNILISACGVAGLNIDNIKTKKMQDNIYIVGDFESDISEKKLYSTKIMMISSIMANIALNEIGFKDDIK